MGDNSFSYFAVFRSPPLFAITKPPIHVFQTDVLFQVADSGKTDVANLASVRFVVQMDNIDVAFEMSGVEELFPTFFTRVVFSLFNWNFSVHISVVAPRVEFKFGTILDVFCTK